MSETKEMKVANIAFLLDRLAADTPPNQQIRELTQNAIEAIRRRHKDGNTEEGYIRWDVDWEYRARSGQYKLCVIDNGDGMTPDQMREYLNSLAVQGANKTQSISQNFGVGAKITALCRNRHGLVYQSWREGHGAMVKLHRDDDTGVYGLDRIPFDGTYTYAAPLRTGVKPRFIGGNGTKVTLLGQAGDENTCLPPEEGGTGINWLIRYLNTRYFCLPDNVKLQVRVLTRDTGRWPAEEPPGAEKTYNLQTIRGAKALYDEYSSDKGTVRLGNADAHWWVFDDPKQSSKDMSTRGGRSCTVGLVFQDEVYIQRIPPASRRLLAGFGIVFGADHVVIFIEPRINPELDIRADTARSRVLIDGEDIEEANWWEIWGQEFKAKMPAAIQSKIESIMAKTEGDPDGKTRERILDRLRRIRELLMPSRYRRNAQGQLRGAGQVMGGSGPSDSEVNEGAIQNSQTQLPRPVRPQRHGGRASNDYLADLVATEGEPVVPVNISAKEPQVTWISLQEGTRGDDELEDLAAEIQGDVLSGDIVKANADFRGYRDVVDYFGREFNPGGDEAIARRITEHTREWMESQLIEAIMTTRNLVNGRTWDKDNLEKALAPQALTAVLMPRFHVVERVRRSLGGEVAKALGR